MLNIHLDITKNWAPGAWGISLSKILAGRNSVFLGWIAAMQKGIEEMPKLSANKKEQKLACSQQKLWMWIQGPENLC